MRACPLTVAAVVAVLVATGPVAATASLASEDIETQMRSASVGVVTVCPVADAFITPPQRPPIPPITRDADSLRVEIRLAGPVPSPGLRAWGLEITFDDTKLRYEKTLRTAFTNATDWPSFSGQLVSGMTNQIKIQSAVGVQDPAMPGDPEALAIVVFSVLDNQEPGPANFTTLNHTDDFGNEPQFLQLNVPPCPFSLPFDNRGTGDLDGGGTLTPGDALCTEKGAQGFDVLPDDCVTRPGPPPNASNLAPIERYEADVNCDGYITSLDADTIFDAYFCPGGVTPVPCLAKTDFCVPTPEPAIIAMSEVRGYATDKMLRLGRAEHRDGQVRIPLEVRGTGRISAFGLDFVHSSELEIATVEPSRVTNRWTRFAHRELGTTGVRIGAYDLEGLVLSSNEWTTLGYIVVPHDPGALDDVAGSFRLRATVDDLAGAPLVTQFVEPASGTVRSFALGIAQPNPAPGQVTIRYAVPEGSEQRVTIEVFNVRGQAVRTLVSGYHAAGEHEVSWDGRSSSGNAVAAGAYFYRMRAGSFAETRKLIIVSR